jgi:hypothetical protein
MKDTDNRRLCRDMAKACMLPPPPAEDGQRAEHRKARNALKALRRRLRDGR